MENKRFWGLHFDFHAKNTIEVGGRTDPKDIEAYIEAAKPDFIQCDSKGHEGNSSYPTKCGKPADLMQGDNLRIWRDVTRKHGLPLYVHYSGVFDDEYVKAHPTEGQRTRDGKLTGKISLFGNYLDDCMIPQLKEFSDDYGMDGAWIDGDCWAVEQDFSDKAKAAIGEELSPIDHNLAMRQAFLDYAKKYIDAIHAHNPDFKITSNWLYSAPTPDRPDVNVDFISGDLSDVDSVHDVRFAARSTALKKKPWDLMAWGFEWSHFTHKPAVMLMQEAAIPLAHGGGFQVYVRQNMDGSARRVDCTRLKEVAEFVRAREMLYGKEPVAQVGILYSEYGYYHCREKDGKPFANGGTRDSIAGAMHAILDNQYTLNILCDYQHEDFAKYDIIAISEWDDIGEDMKRILVDYTHNGGKLLLIGDKICRSIAKAVGTEFGETYSLDEVSVLGNDGCFAAINDARGKKKINVVDLLEGEGRLYANADLRDDILPSYRIDSYGKGKIAYIPFDLGNEYRVSRCYLSRNYLGDIMKELSSPIIEINKKNIDLVLQKNEDGYILNLINMLQGRHALYVSVYDEVPEIHGVTVKVKGKFKSVSMPLGEKFTYEISENSAIIHLDKLEIHSIIELK